MSDPAAVEAILFAALELGSAAERAAYLDTACAGDAELRRQVEKLLKAHANVGDFLLKPAAELLAAAPVDPNLTTDHGRGAQASTDQSHPVGDAPGGGLPAVPGYRVLREIARGGMGRVLAARDLTLDRDIALKILLPGANPTRFVRESKITARLPHPGIPPVHALGTLADGSPFLAMKLIAGQTLGVEMKTDDRPRLLQVFLQVCQAVGFAHSRGIVHRDLKPANIMVSAFGEVQVMDWGLAKDVTSPDTRDEPGSSAAPAAPMADADPAQTTDHRAAGESTDDQTQAGTVMGTPAYMAPEQARGEASAARTDVFALGGILCAILTGKAPYTGKSAVEVIKRAAAADLAEAYARLDECGADAELVALCRRCLSANPADRPADGLAVADGLTAYLNGVQERLQTAQRERAVAVAREVEQRKRRKVQLALAAAVVTLLLGGVVGASLYLMADQQARNDKKLSAAAEEARQDRERREKEVRDAEERGRLGRNAETVAGHLQEAEKALHDGDVAKTRVLLEAAVKQAKEGGADDSSARFALLRKDLAVLIELDEFDQLSWTMGVTGFPEEEEELPRLRKVLARFGLNPGSPPEEAAARVKGSAVRDRLVTALDDWMIVEPLPWVRAVLQGADPHPYRDAVRDAFMAEAGVKLGQLLFRPQAAEQPPGFVAVWCAKNEYIPVKLRREMLKSALLRNPRNLTLLMTMAESYDKEKASAAEQVRWLQAAVTVAPENGAAHYNLGSALADKGDLNGAIAHFRKAAQLAPKTAVAYFYRSDVPKDEADLDAAIAVSPKKIELDPPTDARAYVLLGSWLKADGNLDGAMDSYRKAIELEPRYARAHQYLGIVLSKKGDRDGAIAHYRKAIEVVPKYVGAHYNLGNALKEKGDLEGAIGCWRKSIELNPKHDKSYTNLGLALQVRGDKDGAIDHFRKAIKLNPKQVEAHTGMGSALRAKGDLDGALPYFHKAVELAPKSALTHTNLGVVLRDKGDLDGAIANCRAAIELDGKYAPAYHNLGLALKDKGDVDGAIDQLREAVKLAPKNALAHSNLGLALRAKGDLDGALLHLHRTVKLAPTALAHDWLGFVLREKGDLDGAIANFRAAIELDRKYAAAYQNLGLALRAKGDLDGAIDNLRKAISLNPKNGAAYSNLGAILRNRGDVDEAIDNLRKALQINPKDTTAIVYLGLALNDRGDVDGAIDHLRKAVKVVPKNAWVHDTLGYVLLVRGDLDEASDFFRKAISLNPKYRMAHTNLARAERIAPVQGKLPALLKGDYQPKTNDERLALAELCALRRLYRAAAGLFADAFAADPKVSADLKTGRRYDAVCCAALAGTGRGEDAAGLDGKEKARLRQQSLDWLRADLLLRTQQLESGLPADRAEVRQKLTYWQNDSDLAGVRDADALAKLPAEERTACERLWADVAALRKKAETPAP
jgi:tetratricopeptide (TPR) repeat protein